MSIAPNTPPPSPPGLRELGLAFLRLGCTSFGGPIAHLGYFERDVVHGRRWLSHAEYAELVALCQFLPGPASSQVVFAIGHRCAGLPGAAVASAAFLAPSALLMVVLGSGWVGGVGWGQTPWLRGLQLAAVAVVAHAVYRMAVTLCPDWPRRAVGLASLGLCLTVSNQWIQLGVLALAGAVGFVLGGKQDGPVASAPPRPVGLGPRLAGHLWSLGLVVSLVLPWLRPGESGLNLAAMFYRAGALVFGGGHVVLPWLREGVVPTGWVSSEAFLAGYGAAQALPGPLFAFAGYLGALAVPGPASIWAGLGAISLLYLPAWLSVYAALPYWARLRSQPRLRRGLASVNAAVVGFLAAVGIIHLLPTATATPLGATVALIAFLGLSLERLPVWAVVALCAGAGYLL